MTKKDIRANGAVLVKEGTDKDLVLENKIKEFKEGSDYTLSFGKNSEKIFEIHSLELKKNLWEINMGRKISPLFIPKTWNFVVVVRKNKELSEKDDNSEIKDVNNSKKSQIQKEVKTNSQFLNKIIGISSLVSFLFLLGCWIKVK